MTTTVTVPYEFEPKDIEFVLVAALEGGIRYWAPRVELPETDAPYHTATVFEYDDAGLIPHVLTLDRVIAGLRLTATTHPKIFARIVNQDYDAADADIVLQLAIFGEARYG